MKNQYFADKRDFLKYDLLLDLYEKVSLIERLVSVLMLTQDDRSDEGRFTQYDCGGRRVDLHRFLQEQLRAGRREVATIRGFMKEQGVDYLPHKDDEYFIDQGRTAYFAEVATLGIKSAIVFFDPNIGLETGKMSYMRTRGVEKYLFYEEVEAVSDAADPSSLFVIYQHLQNNSRLHEQDLKRRTDRLSEHIGSSQVSYVTDRDIAFLVTCHDAEIREQAFDCLREYGSRHHDVRVGPLES